MTTEIQTPEGIVEAGGDFAGNSSPVQDAVVDTGVAFDGNEPIPTSNTVVVEDEINDN